MRWSPAARGVDPIAEADLDNYEWMYQVNVLGTVRLTKALLPQWFPPAGADVLLVTSIAGHVAYEGGGGYCAAKSAERAVGPDASGTGAGNPRPGDPKSRPDGQDRGVRRLGETRSADAVYAGVEFPLWGRCCRRHRLALTRPHHVNVDLMILKPRAQAAVHKVHRGFLGAQGAQGLGCTRCMGWCTACMARTESADVGCGVRHAGLRSPRTGRIPLHEAIHWRG